METVAAAEVKPGPAADAPPAPAPAPEAQPAQPERTFSQKELDDILEKRLAKERRKRDELRAERDVLRKLALENRPAAAPQQPTEEQPAKPQAEPTRDQFQSYEEFIEARAAYRGEKAANDRIAKDKAERDRQRAAEEAKKAGEDFRRRAKETAKDHADFDEIMASITPESPVARILADPIASSDAPGKLLYYLATHPEEAERIASLPLGNQAREVWKLEQTLAAPAAQATPPQPSKAPEPIKPVGGKAAVGDEMPDPAKDPQGWLKWRQAGIRAKTAKRA